MAWILNPEFKAYVQWHLATRIVRLRTYEQARRETFKWRYPKIKPEPEELERTRPMRRRAGTRTSLPFSFRKLRDIVRASGLKRKEVREVLEELIELASENRKEGPYSFRGLLGFARTLNLKLDEVRGTLGEIIDEAELYVFLDKHNKAPPPAAEVRKDLFKLRESLGKTEHLFAGIEEYEKLKGHVRDRLAEPLPPRGRQGDQAFHRFVEKLSAIWEAHRSDADGRREFVGNCLYPLVTKKAEAYRDDVDPDSFRRQISRIFPRQKSTARRDAGEAKRIAGRGLIQKYLCGKL